MSLRLAPSEDWHQTYGVTSVGHQLIVMVNTKKQHNYIIPSIFTNLKKKVSQSDDDNDGMCDNYP